MQTVEIEATELRKNTLYDQVTLHRAMTSRKPLEIGTSYLTQKTCISDEVKLWNLPPCGAQKCHYSLRNEEGH